MGQKARQSQRRRLATVSHAHPSVLQRELFWRGHVWRRGNPNNTGNETLTRAQGHGKMEERPGLPEGTAMILILTELQEQEPQTSAWKPTRTFPPTGNGMRKEHPRQPFLGLHSSFPRKKPWEHPGDPRQGSLLGQGGCSTTRQKLCSAQHGPGSRDWEEKAHLPRVEEKTLQRKNMAPHRGVCDWCGHQCQLPHAVRKPQVVALWE